MCVSLQVQALALELQSLHFSASRESTRKVASELRAILSSVEGACLAQENGTVRCLLQQGIIYVTLFSVFAALVAQLIEHRTKTLECVGSNPVQSSSMYKAEQHSTPKAVTFPKKN